MADERLIDLLAPDVRTVVSVPWPGSEQAVGILLLRSNEIEEAQVAARLWMRKRGMDTSAPENQELLGRAEDLEMMVRMLVEPDTQGGPGARLFKDRAEVARRTDPDQRAYLLDWHIAHQEEATKGYVYPEDADGAK